MTASTSRLERPAATRQTHLGPGVVLGLAAAALLAVVVQVALHAGAQTAVALLIVLMAGAGLQRVCFIAADAARDQVTGAVARVVAIYAAVSIVPLLVLALVLL